jgi:hypothetical protein
MITAAGELFQYFVEGAAGRSLIYIFFPLLAFGINFNDNRVRSQILECVPFTDRLEVFWLDRIRRRWPQIRHITLVPRIHVDLRG